MNCYVCLWICTKKNCTIFYLLHNNFCFGCKLFKKNVKECWEIALKSVIWSKTDNNRPTPTCWYYVRTILNWLSLLLLSSILVVVQPPMLWCCLDRGLSLTEAKPQFTSNTNVCHRNCTIVVLRTDNIGVFSECRMIIILEN